MARTVMNNDPDWWRGAVIYQIYPRSFQDSDGDGIGDLDGIRTRLEHVAELGADAVWISPFYPSPMKDFGYDVSDHCDIDPMFGDLASFDAMLDRAHELGIRVLIDLVLSHTSDQHAWFLESSTDRSNKRQNWYVWADAKLDGGPPNNWLSIFGGPGWSWHPTRRQYFQHNFLDSQPDLNFHNPAVQDAVLEVARFWLDRGVDGFRLDTINFYFCDARLRDNPPAPDRLPKSTDGADPGRQREDELGIELTDPSNPYGYQDHIHDKNQAENLVFLERFRLLLDQYPGATSVGEIGDARYAHRLLREYSSGTSRVHMCYTFDLLTGDAPDAAHTAQLLRAFKREAAEAWVCWAMSNHDVPRHATRWDIPGVARTDRLTFLASLLISLRGSVCLYQGEELGLSEAVVALEDIQDPYGLAFWPAYKGRDGCRTPMVWSAQDEYGGFSEVRPWLPIPDEHRELAAERQTNEADALLQRYRSLLAFRRSEPALRLGSIDEIDAEGDLLQFTRSVGRDRLRCVFNFGTTPLCIDTTSAGHGPLVDNPVLALNPTVNPAGSGEGMLKTGNTDQVLPPSAAAWMRIASDD